MSDKHVLACIEYAAAAKEVRLLSREIGLRAEACYTKQRQASIAAGATVWTSFQEREHLKEAISPEKDDYGNSAYLSDDEVIELLEGVCEHCLAAFYAIKRRKLAKARLGRARRKISLLGASASKSLTPNEDIDKAPHRTDNT